jgi:hypothetical protein
MGHESLVLLSKNYFWTRQAYDIVHKRSSLVKEKDMNLYIEAEYKRILSRFVTFGAFKHRSSTKENDMNLSNKNRSGKWLWLKIPGTENT